MSFKLEPNEHVLLIVRRHWFRPFYITLGLIFSLIIPIMALSAVYSLDTRASEFGNLGILAIIFALIWLFVIWNIAFIEWTNHYLDVVVVTNLHIIDIDQIGIWHREVSTLSLGKIQDVSSETKGIVASILNFGTLEIQTAGSMNNFILERVERPDAIRQEIMKQCNLHV